MSDSSTCGIGIGPELYNEIHRLICEWRGLDVLEQTAAIPRLVERLAQLKMISPDPVARAAAHDAAPGQSNAEAA